MKKLKGSPSSGGLQKGPRGGTYKMVNGKKVYERWTMAQIPLRGDKSHDASDPISLERKVGRDLAKGPQLLKRIRKKVKGNWTAARGALKKMK